MNKLYLVLALLYILHCNGEICQRSTKVSWVIISVENFPIIILKSALGYDCFVRVPLF